MTIQENLRFLRNKFNTYKNLKSFQLKVLYLISIIIIVIIHCSSQTYGLYLIRWQLSTPTLAIFSALTVSKLTGDKLRWANKYEWAGAVVANLIGGIVFYWFDKILIFKI